MKALRRLYDWVLHWADTPYGTPALFLLAFSESSFFPIPPDVLLIALGIARPRRALYFALVASVGSVVGGVLGYLIGLYGFDAVGRPIIEFYGAMDKYLWIQERFETYDFLTIWSAGFTPIPYKVFTISAGAFKINFWVFLIASVTSRSARFFIVGGLIRKYGMRIKDTIDRYFNLCTIIFTVLLVLGFVIVKLVLH
jgi:membrane protein YqaA with SNARE-associated domain